MSIALLTLVAILQTQSPKPQIPVHTVATPAAAPTPVAPTAPALAQAAPAEGALTEEPEPAGDPEAELPTRQVCRYVEVTGQRFPVRTCRTVTVHPSDQH